jgi:hypothetical protein
LSSDLPAPQTNIFCGKFDPARGFCRKTNIEPVMRSGKFDCPRHYEPHPILDVIDDVGLLMVSTRFLKQSLKQ